MEKERDSFEAIIFLIEKMKRKTLQENRTNYFHRLPTALTLHIFSFLVYSTKRKCLITSSLFGSELSLNMDRAKKMELQLKNELFFPEPKERYQWCRIQSCSTEYILLSSHELIRIRDFKIVPGFLVDAPQSARFWPGSVTNNDQIIWQEYVMAQSFFVQNLSSLHPSKFKITLPPTYSHAFCRSNRNFFFWNEYGENNIHVIPLSEFFNENFTFLKELEFCDPFRGTMEVLGLQSSSSFLTVKCRLFENETHSWVGYFLVWNLKNFRIVNVITSCTFVPNMNYIRSWKMNDSFLCLELDEKTLLFSPILSWKKNLLQIKQFDQSIESWCMNETSLFVSFQDYRIVHYQIRML